MLNFFKFVLNSNLKLKDFVSIIGVLDLLTDLGGIVVKGRFEQRLGVVHLVRINIREKLGQLVIAVGSVTIVLDLKVTKAQKGKGGSISWRKLKLIRQDINDLMILLVSDERVNRLGILAIRDSFELIVHLKFEN